MRRNVFLFLILYIPTIILASNPVLGAPAKYDAIIVRSDLPYDWTVAQAYSQQAKIPIITTFPDYLSSDSLGQLRGFVETGHTSLLVFGGEVAISPSIEAQLVDEGFVTHRVREVDRYGTSARVAVELYGQSRRVVLVVGEDMDGLLNAQMAALQSGAPILFIKRSVIPNSVKEALNFLGATEILLIPSGVSEELRAEIGSKYQVRVFPDDELLTGSGQGSLRLYDILIGLFLGVALSALLRHRRRERVPLNVLTEDEEKVVLAIEENGGVLGQDELYSKTGFSRPKISRIVSELVKRDLIEKTQFKRSFKLKIKKELVKG